jgi:hypothetical protein
MSTERRAASPPEIPRPDEKLASAEEFKARILAEALRGASQPGAATPEMELMRQAIREQVGMVAADGSTSSIAVMHLTAMLERLYEWRASPNEEAVLAVARIFCRYGDTGFDWDDPRESYGSDAESRAGILQDAERALREAWGASQPGGTPIVPGAAPSVPPETDLREDLERAVEETGGRFLSEREAEGLDSVPGAGQAPTPLTIAAARRRLDSVVSEVTPDDLWPEYVEARDRFAAAIRRHAHALSSPDAVTKEELARLLKMCQEGRDDDAMLHEISERRVLRGRPEPEGERLTEQSMEPPEFIYLRFDANEATWGYERTSESDVVYVRAALRDAPPQEGERLTDVAGHPDREGAE